MPEDLKPIICSTPLPYLLKEKTPQEFVRFYLLVAVRDGVDRLALRPGGIWYDMFGRYNGEELGIIGPTSEAVQEFPAILAGLGGVQTIGRNDGSESGEFVFPVGPGSVRGTYRVRWEKGMVAGLEIDLPIVDMAVAEAAGNDLRESARAREAAEALKPRDLAEQPKPNLTTTSSGKAALNTFAEFAAFFKKDEPDSQGYSLSELGETR